MTVRSTEKLWRALAQLAALAAALWIMVVAFAPATAQELTVAAVTPAELSQALVGQRQGVSPVMPRLTNEMLAAYVERQKQLKSVSFDLPAAAPAISEEMLLGYIARRQNQALDAIEAVDNTDAALTPELLSSYAEDKFVPTAKRVKLADSERNCLAQAIYFEARGESPEGQLAVANVVINRAFSGKFPTTICGVVFQNADNGKYKCQFSFACDGLPDVGREKRAWANALELADTAFREFQRGQRPGVVPASVLFYHTAAVNPGWSTKFRRVAAIGAHVFYEN